MEEGVIVKISLSASITPNPVSTKGSIKVSVFAEEVIIEPWYHSGDIYSGEA